MKIVNLLKNEVNIVSMLTIILIIILAFIPNFFEKDLYPNAIKAKAEVISVNNDYVAKNGLIRSGEQVCIVKIMNGKFKGQTAEAVNTLSGRLEVDKYLMQGDKIFVVIDFTENNITHITVIDHYRLDLELYLSIAFIIVLLLVGKGVGLRSLLSFVFTILMLWKILIPAILIGYNAIMVSLVVVGILISITIMLIFGFDKRSFAAIIGGIAGILLTSLMSLVFVKIFKIDGTIIDFSESLLYSGFQQINLTDVFTACIFIAASGAIMDICVDISAAMWEIKEQSPNITRTELVKSGFNIGRANIGTMTTTLLLAYSGGYIGLLMVFMAQGTPIENILNLNYVSAEILNTIIGSFGLVTVAPLTAIVCGISFAKNESN